MIERDHRQLPLAVQCQLLGVSRSSLYYRPQAVSPEEVALKHRIDEIYTDCPFYGSRRLTAQLRREGHQINRKRVQRYMRHGFAARAAKAGVNARFIQQALGHYSLDVTQRYMDSLTGDIDGLCQALSAL